MSDKVEHTVNVKVADIQEEIDGAFGSDVDIDVEVDLDELVDDYQGDIMSKVNDDAILSEMQERDLYDSILVDMDDDKIEDEAKNRDLHSFIADDMEDIGLIEVIEKKGYNVLRDEDLKGVEVENNDYKRFFVDFLNKQGYNLHYHCSVTEILDIIRNLL